MSDCRRVLSALALVCALSALPHASLAAPAAAKKSQAKRSARPIDRSIAHPDDADCIDTNGDYVACSTIAPVQYYGFGVVSNPQVWVIFWTSAVDATTQQKIGSFYEAVTNSEIFDWMVEYDTEGWSPGTNQRIGRGVFAGSYVINPTTTSSKSVSDGDIETELKSQFDNGTLPQPDDNSLYMVYFPAGYTITQSGGDASCTKFCAYHDTFTYSGQDVYYGVFPDLATGGCQNGCMAASTAFDSLCSASTHELIETVTDAEVGLTDISFTYIGPEYAWDSQQPASGQNAGNEVGDICNQMTGQITSVIDGEEYTVQQIWSRSALACGTDFVWTDADYQFYAGETLVILAPGTSASIPLTQNVTAGAPPAHAITLTGGLANVTTSLDKSTLSGNDGTHLHVTAAANATINSQALFTLTANDPTLMHTKTAAVLVRIEPAPTSLSLTPIHNGSQVNGTVALQGSASPASSRSLMFVGLYIDNALVASGTSSVSYSWNTSALASGSSHSVLLYAEDSDGGNAELADTVVIQGTPTAQITAPASGATVSGMVTLSAAATAAGGSTLAHLALGVDGAQVATQATSPISFSWDSTQVANGAHTLSATATDADGQSASATPVSISVHNLPTISLSPQTQSVNGTIALKVTAAPTHGGAISSVALSIDGTQVVQGNASPLSYSWDTSALAESSTHTLSATVIDADGASSSATETVTRLEGPVVNITAPRDGATVSGDVLVTAAAAPAPGTAVSSLVVLLDGAMIASAAAGTGAVTTHWDSTAVANGAHTLEADASDADGASSKSTVTVTVQNSAGASSDFTLSLSPPHTTLTPGGPAQTVAVHTTTIGPAQPIALTVLGLPEGVTYTFSPTSVTAGNSAALSLTAAATAAVADGVTFSVGGTSAAVPRGHSASATVSIGAGNGDASSGCSSFGGWELALLGLLPLARRRRSAR